MNTRCTCSVWVVCAVLAVPASLYAQTPMGTAFTYQGRLTDGGSPANGQYDFRFRLYDAPTSGSQVGTSLEIGGVDVVNGLFTVPLDFGGAPFQGSARWLAIEVKPSAGGLYVRLSPRQELTPAPYALFAGIAGSVLGGGTGLWQQNGSSIFYNDGLVGIGTNGPVTQLDVVSGSITAIQGRCTGEGTLGALGHEYAGVYGSGAMAAYFDGGGYFSGNVGIGVTSPGQRLSVNGVVESMTGGFKFPDGTIQTTAGGGTSIWQQSGSDIYYNTGNVGIGKTSPVYRLELGNSGDPANWLRISGVTTTGILFHDGTDSHSGAINYDNVTESFTFHTRQGSGMNERMRLDTNGYLGIGTAPSYRLDLGDASDAANFMRIGGSASNGILFYDGEGSFSGSMVYDHSSDYLRFQTRNAGGSAEVMRLTSSGRLGLGNTDPAYKLELGNTGENYNYLRIDAASYAGLMFYDGEGSHSGMIRYDHTGDFMEFHTKPSGGAAQERMRLTSTGYLGLGTAIPSARVHVQPPAGVDAIRVSNSSGTATPFVVGPAGHVDITIDSATHALDVINNGIGQAIVAETTNSQPTIVAINNGAGDSIQGKAGSDTVFRVASDGITHVDILAVEGGSDLAERFDVGSGAGPGMVVEIDPDQAGRLRVARKAYSRLVAGVISGANGVNAGMILADLPDDRDSQPVALTGRVWVHCDATDRPIRPGDLMTTADRAGHAMAVIDHDRAQGAVLGKAMTALKKGTGLVLVLVTLQ